MSGIEVTVEEEGVVVVVVVVAAAALEDMFQRVEI